MNDVDKCPADQLATELRLELVSGDIRRDILVVHISVMLSMEYLDYVILHNSIVTGK